MMTEATPHDTNLDKREKKEFLIWPIHGLASAEQAEIKGEIRSVIGDKVALEKDCPMEGEEGIVSG